MDVESAARNAAENALKQVVGSFIETERNLDRRSQVVDGVRSEVRDLRASVRDYSQGSIQRFDMLDARQENGLVRVKAQVVVRIDELRAYTRRAVEAEAQMGPGLFAQVATQSKQQGTAQSLLEESVLRPILTGQALQIDMGRPIPLSEAGLHLQPNQVADSPTTIVLRPIAFLPPAALTNMKNVLRNIAARTDRVQDNGQRYQEYRGRREDNEFPITVCPRVGASERPCEVYLLRGIDGNKIGAIIQELSGIRYSSIDTNARNNVKVRAEIQAADGSVVADYMMGGQMYSYAKTNFLAYTEQFRSRREGHAVPSGRIHLHSSGRGADPRRRAGLTRT